MTKQEASRARKAIVLARAWRTSQGYDGRGGVVVLWDGNVQGWVDRLRDPQDWTPGCLAVMEGGVVYEARGGDGDTGAQEWRRLSAAKP